jgi:H+-transporting ATPase
LAYLMLSVAGHLTIFQARTRGPFWSIRPARILLIAVVGTQAIATLIAVYGFLMAPIGWRWAAFVWAYALVWFLLTDPVKLLAYRVFDPANAAANAKTRANVASESTVVATSAEATVGFRAVPEAQIGNAQEPNVVELPSLDKQDVAHPASNELQSAVLSAQIALRAYKLYEEGGRQEGASVRDWEKAEAEIRTATGKAASAQ